MGASTGINILFHLYAVIKEYKFHCMELLLEIMAKNPWD